MSVGLKPMVELAVLALTLFGLTGSFVLLFLLMDRVGADD